MVICGAYSEITFMIKLGIMVISIFLVYAHCQCGISWCHRERVGMIWNMASKAGQYHDSWATAQQLINYIQGVIVRVANPIKVKIRRQSPRRSWWWLAGRLPYWINKGRERKGFPMASWFAIGKRGPLWIPRTWKIEELKTTYKVANDYKAVFDETFILLSHWNNLV